MQQSNHNSGRFAAVYLAATLFLLIAATVSAQGYPIVDTGQNACYDEFGAEITCRPALDDGLPLFRARPGAG